MADSIDSRTGARKLDTVRECGCRSAFRFDCTALRRRMSLLNRIEPCACLCH